MTFNDVLIIMILSYFFFFKLLTINVKEFKNSSISYLYYISICKFCTIFYDLIHLNEISLRELTKREKKKKRLNVF